MNFDQFWIEIIRAVAWPVAFYAAVLVVAGIVEDWLNKDEN